MQGQKHGKGDEYCSCLILAGGKGRCFIDPEHSCLCVSIFSMQVILYIYEFMDKNRKEEKYWYDLLAGGGLRVNPSDVVVVPKVAEVT